MFKTSFGAFDGTSWEALCQQVFKQKYACDGYQHIPATPGDFGLEGFCAATGIGFQCYCPDNHYTRKELYGHQRDKITEDLKKLLLYKTQLSKILGATKISIWRFVTPEIAHNDLIQHARSKESEVKAWDLPFVAPNFSIELHDADYYLSEINWIRAAAGEALDFQDSIPELPELADPQEVYEENVLRKSTARLAAKIDSPNHATLINQLHQRTLDTFLASDGYFRRIEKTAPLLYFKVVRLINEFEIFVEDQAITYTGPPEQLTNSLRHDLEKRLIRLGPELTEATAATIARHMVARWLAVCSLNYD